MKINEEMKLRKLYYLNKLNDKRMIGSEKL